MSQPGEWRRWAGYLFVTASFVFLAAVVQRNWGEMRGFSWELRPVRLALSVGAHVAVLVWGVWVWHLVLRRLGAVVGFHATARVWFLSSLGRYIPGKIWQFVGAAHLGAAVGLEPFATVTSLALQTGFSLLAAALVAVYLLPPDVMASVGAGVDILRWLAPALLLLVHPRVIGAALALFQRVTRRATAEWAGGWGDGLLLLALSVVGWLLFGVALYLFVSALVPLEWSSVRLLAGAHALSFLVGYLVFIAPAGLGAKEGALALLLASLIPAPVATLVAVAARLWSVVSEVIPALALLRGPRPDGG